MPTKQEKMREEIMAILQQRYGNNWIHGKVATQILYVLGLYKVEKK